MLSTNSPGFERLTEVGVTSRAGDPVPDTSTIESDAERGDILLSSLEETNKKSAAPTWGDNAPDGGAAAWLVVLGAWCTAFCSFGWINSIGIFQEYYERELLNSYSASAIAWISSLQIFFMFAMGPIVGKIYDRQGPRNLLIIGTFLQVFGLMMASISTQYYQILLSQGICSSIGMGCIFQPGLTTVAGWFTRKRGAAYGALSTGSSLGGVIFPIMISRLIREVGYGWAMRIAAFLILFLLIIAIFTVKARNPPHPQNPTKEELLSPFKEPVFLIVVAGSLLLTFGIFIPITYVVVSATADGMSEALSQYVIAVLNAASLFGRLGCGILAVKIGSFNVLISACCLSGILTFSLWIPASSNASNIIYAALFGFTSGAYFSLIPALVSQTSPPKQIGFRTGMLFLFISPGALTTGPIAGAILARENGDFLGMKVFAGVFMIAGAIIVLAARLHATGLKLNSVF